MIDSDTSCNQFLSDHLLDLFNTLLYSTDILKIMMNSFDADFL